MFMDSACACDDLYPLPVEEKAIMESEKHELFMDLAALAVAFSSSLSRKRPFHGLGARLRWAFPPACRGKGRLMDLVCACDGLYPLSVQEKLVSGLPGVPQRGPERSQKVARELPSQKTIIFVLDLLSKQC